MAQQTISKMETVQTAVEWLVEELKSKGHALITTKGIFINVPNELLEQAKVIEKEQIEKAIDDALNAYGIIKKH